MGIAVGIYGPPGVKPAEKSQEAPKPQEPKRETLHLPVKPQKPKGK